MSEFKISNSDFIDVALVIMAKTQDRDIIDFYLGLLPHNLNDEDFENFLLDKEFFITGYEDLSDDIDTLKDILKEIGKWG